MFVNIWSGDLVVLVTNQMQRKDEKDEFIFCIVVGDATMVGVQLIHRKNLHKAGEVVEMERSELKPFHL